MTACNPPPPTPTPQPRYSCSGNSCVYNPGGAFTSPTCGGTCNPPPERYSCSGSSCVLNPSGPYTLSNCGGNCVVSTPEPTPTPTPCTTCGCPGVPCNCYGEQDCGDITLYDCCAGICVPEGTQCTSGVSCVHNNRAANVWVRVISNENNQTASWKGNQSNSPIIGNNWSAGGLDPDGYFTTYKPYDQDGTKTFNKTMNPISDGMQVIVDSFPKYPETYTNACDETEYYPTDGNALAHGVAWSNHFCAAGYAYDADGSGMYPQETNNYCSTEDDSGSPYYFAVPLADEDLDCDSSPRIWPVADPDGCYSGLSQPGGGEPGSDGVYTSFHPDLVPLLQYTNSWYSSNGKGWVNLPYDGQWSMTYQAYDIYQSTDDIDTEITVIPPTGHTCGDMRWFNKLGDDVREQGAVMIGHPDGSCTINFNPKAHGNLVIVEVNRNKTQSCTVQLEAADDPNNLTESINTGGAFNVHVTGHTSEVIPPATERTRLYMAKRDFSQITTKPSTFTEVPTSYGFVYQYNIGNSGTLAQCLANSDESCSMTVGISEGALADSNGTTSDEYVFFCDSVEGANKCSGSHLCSYNGGPENCSSLYGINDCVDDTLTPDDNATAQLQCVPNCTACSLQGSDDGCGGTCSAGANVTMTATGPTINLPASNQEVTENLAGPTEYYFPMSWTPVDTNNVNGYEYIIYRQGIFANAQEAYEANQAHLQSTSPPQRDPDVLFHAYANGPTNTGFGAVPAPTGTQYTLGRDFVAAVRSANALLDNCGSGTYVYSNWTTKSFTLRGTVSGTIYDDPTDSGSTTTPVTNFSPAAVPVVRGILPSFTTNGTITGSTYSVPNLPYYHPDWIYPYTRELRINNSDPSNWFLCSGGGGQAGVNTEICTVADSTAAPEGGAHFFVKSLNLAFDSWWQSWGGSVFGQSSVISSIPDGSLSPCNLEANCHPHLVAANHSVAGTTNQSAGVPVTGGASIDSGADSRFSEHDTGGVDNPRAAEQETESVTRENFTYFMTGTTLSASNNVTATTQNRSQFEASLDNGELQADGTRVVRYDTNLTLNLSTVGDKLTINNGEKFVVIIPGNLTIQGPTSSHTAGNQQYLIRVNNGGYLAFIVDGNITFDSAIGYDDPNGIFDDAEIAAYTAPNVEGVYIASGVLEVASTGVGDYKFVGAGTFVGWSGVSLPRAFDSSNILRRQLNNTSPTDLFIHRPDFVTNTPDFMLRPGLTWQEVP